jgi:eukaryotic-like serine/threonine-protein kinase
LHAKPGFPPKTVEQLAPGEVLGHYHILEKVGEGGMGEVYRAVDEHLGCDVAIKVLPPGSINDESARQRFHKEARVLARLNHSNIAIVHNFDTQQGVDYLVMEYIPGITLSEKVASGKLPEKEVIRLGTQLADGLSAAHEHGVIHRDLKPGNLRLSTDGGLKILDFGLAKLRLPATASTATESITEMHGIVGTLPYMAPEQLLDGEIDARTDIHAAGSVLYEMATGQCPFAEVERSQLIGAILSRPPLPPGAVNPRLSPELERIILKCLEKEPENRYQSAKELAIDLHRLEHQSQTEHLSRSLHAGWGMSLRGRRRRTKLMVLALVSALAVVVLILPKLRRWEDARSEKVPRFQALAVLPLVDLSGDPAREYFADGMTEELITQLGKVTSARVISRQSVMQFKGTKMPLTEIAQKLKVDAVVEGSVLQSGNRVRVTARLVDAAAEKPVWTEEYERDLRDVLSLQDEVTRAIANEIRMTITPREQVRLAKPRAVNPEAYEAYLKGRFQWYKISQQGLEDATHYFQLALEKDPNYALAYAGLADVWAMRADAGYAAPSETLPKAKAAALKALQLDGTLSEAHVSLGNIEAEYERDWVAAERDFRRAIELNPSSADAHFMYADFLISIGRNQQWQTEVQQAMNLDPMNSFLRCFYGWHLVYLGRYDEAIDVMQKVVATQPNFSSAHMGLWGAYYRKHMEKEALEEAVKFFEALNDQEAVAALTTGYHQAGYREAMRRAAEVLAARAQHSHVAGVRIARLYAHAGDADRALSWLQKAYEARETPLVHLGVAWDWDQLRPDPRFQDLLRRLHFPQS